jgi:hypothetical protein
VSTPNRIWRNDIKADNIEIFGDAEVNKPCEGYRREAKDVNDEYSLNILFQEANVEKMRQNVPENIEEKVVPSQVLKQDIIIDRVKAATMKVHFGHQLAEYKSCDRHRSRVYRSERGISL